MTDFKNFFLNHYNGTLMKKNVNDSKCYFYNLFSKNSNDAYEFLRLTELEKQVYKKEELNVIRDKKISLNTNLIRNSHIFSEITNCVEYGKYKHKFVYQIIWLKEILKYYPSHEEFILNDYGYYIHKIIVSINNKPDNNIVNLIEELLNFANEYKNVILFAIDALNDIECKLLKIPKIEHALQVGIEAYLNGSIKNDGVSAAILSDVLQYSPNNELIRKQIKLNTWDYNGKKVLDIFEKTGQDPNFQNFLWKDRKYAQLNVLRTPGITSFSASMILAISKKITLKQIGVYFSNNFFEKNAEFIKTQKEKFWKEYSNITEEEAKDYYSKIFNILCKRSNIDDLIIEDYENNYYLVFNEYPS